MNNETIDYTLICNGKREIEIRTVIIGVSVIKRLGLYEFTLWGVSVVGIIVVTFTKKCVGIFLGPSELTVLERCPC